MAPLPNRKMTRYINDMDMMADQFKLSLFDGVFFKAISAGSLVCTDLDNKKIRKQ